MNHNPPLLMMVVIVAIIIGIGIGRATGTAVLLTIPAAFVVILGIQIGLVQVADRCRWKFAAMIADFHLAFYGWLLVAVLIMGAVLAVKRCVS